MENMEKVFKSGWFRLYGGDFPLGGIERKGQGKWSTYNQEAYAMVCAVEHWHVYLAGSKFVLNSDHNPLTFFQKKGEVRGKVARWVAILEAFDYEVKYISGKCNVKADALSRNSRAELTQPPDLLEEKIYTVSFENDTFVHQLRGEQEKCSLLDSAKNLVRQCLPVTEGQLKRVSKQRLMKLGSSNLPFL